MNTITLSSSIYKEQSFLKDFIYQRILKLQSKRHHTTFCLFSGHSGIFGNKKVDRAAKNTAEKSGKITELLSSLAYIRKNVEKVQSRAVAQWHETEIRKREIRRRGFISLGQKEELAWYLGMPLNNTAHDFTGSK